MNTVARLKEPTNGGAETISFSEPFTAHVTLQGSSDLLFHRWNEEAVEEKARAAKNSKGKKTDNVESYVYRTESGEIAIPVEYLRGAIIASAKFIPDPRSPRASAEKLFKAAIAGVEPLASLGTSTWDYLDKRRVTVQRNGINRVRPAMRKGWKATFSLMCLLPEYVDPDMLRERIEFAGRLIGLGDFRPTFGRFGVVNFD